MRIFWGGDHDQMVAVAVHDVVARQAGEVIGGVGFAIGDQFAKVRRAQGLESFGEADQAVARLLRGLGEFLHGPFAVAERRVGADQRFEVFDVSQHERIADFRSVGHDVFGYERGPMPPRGWRRRMIPIDHAGKVFLFGADDLRFFEGLDVRARLEASQAAGRRIARQPGKQVETKAPVSLLTVPSPFLRIVPSMPSFGRAGEFADVCSISGTDTGECKPFRRRPRPAAPCPPCARRPHQIFGLIVRRGPLVAGFALGVSAGHRLDQRRPVLVEHQRRSGVELVPAQVRRGIIKAFQPFGHGVFFPAPRSRSTCSRHRRPTCRSRAADRESCRG